MQLFSCSMKIKARSDVKENHIGAVILLESCNLNYPINNCMSCVFLFWNWKCIIITSPWANIAKDGVFAILCNILVQLFCSWSPANLVLLSPVSTAVSSAECLALHLCSDTQGKSMCHWTFKQLQNFDKPSKISHHSWYFFRPRGREEKHLNYVFSLLSVYTVALH